MSRSAGRAGVQRNIWLHAAHDFVFAEDRAASVDEGQERIERPTAQLDRSAIRQQLAAMAHDLEPAKFNGYGIFGLPSHGIGL
jgi:hypothetical protein